MMEDKERKRRIVPLFDNYIIAEGGKNDNENLSRTLLGSKWRKRGGKEEILNKKQRFFCCTPPKLVGIDKNLLHFFQKMDMMLMERLETLPVPFPKKMI